jgi:hypothetical protein
MTNPPRTTEIEIDEVAAGDEKKRGLLREASRFSARALR